MSAHPLIDDLTGDFVRSAMNEARSGRAQRAIEIAQQGIADGADEGVLSALLGTLYCEVGNFSGAIEPLLRAAELRPQDGRIRFTLVAALLRAERYAEAVATLTDGVVDADPTMNFLRQRAYAAHMDGQLDLALADYHRFLAANEGDWETWNNLANAYRNAGNLEEATTALRKAAVINPRAAPTRLNLARTLRDIGDFADAEAELRSMAVDFPHDEKPLVDLYHVLQALGRPLAELEEVLQAAAERAPDNVEIVVELGDLQTHNIEYEKSEENYRRALRLAPSNAAAFLGLARTLEHFRPQDLAELVSEAEAANIDDRDRLNLMRAMTARRAKRHQEGLTALEGVPDDFEAELRWQLAGEMFEAVGRYDEAFAAFEAMNEAHTFDASDPLSRAAQHRALLHHQLERTNVEWRAAWKAPAVASSRPSPVFLVGFPRSGTTLLDTILMGHPDIAVLEEQPMLKSLELGFDALDRIADLGEDQVRGLQAKYFELAAERVALNDDTLLVDKAPLNLQFVPQIMRLFPDARFILAMRHPADVVFGCFKANFRLNNAMSNFLLLDTTAEFYDLTFRAWEKSLELFSPEVHTVRYEAMIENPEAVLRPVIEDLGLKWNERVLDHQKTARDRGLVTTASYAQVTEPIYRHAEGRWRHYRKHLEPVLPVIAPWIEKFGYAH